MNVMKIKYTHTHAQTLTLTHTHIRTFTASVYPCAILAALSVRSCRVPLVLLFTNFIEALSCVCVRESVCVNVDVRE
jgi:hypothetical protein